MAAKKVEKVNLFALRRALTPTPGIMYSLDDDGAEAPIIVQQVKTRSTQSHAAWKGDKVNNLQTIEQAFLPHNADTLKVSFGLKVYFDAPAGGNIESCSSSELVEQLKALSASYLSAGGFDYLAGCYATQILNGSWLWRNREGANLTVSITPYVDGEERGPISSNDEDAHKKLSSLIAVGLKGEGFVDFAITGTIRLGFGQEVYPSQEFSEPAKSTDKVSRTFYKDNNNYGMMHSQKIGNALRRIDIWHPSVKLVGELPVEPFGSSLSDQKAYRYKIKRDFYHYLDVLLGGKSASASILDAMNAQHIDDLHRVEDIHFFMAVLCRGGVFGSKNES